ncbi:hypothetical protein GF380_00860 [Candidatus Uhrbacteria bacterium]|nr:hypothetical protein [Candidatus Uhrbacteria bacterium]MBD3284664.1 hypothetical protein [Candidatus Uhrbacteria bacterium]
MLMRGQSLLELLIAMTVIIVGLTAAGTLIFSNIRLQEQSSQRVVAANLAREGIEIAKAVRDSNWLKNVDFRDGMYDTGNDYTGVPDWVQGQVTGFDFSPDDIDDAGTAIIVSNHASSVRLMVQEASGHPVRSTTFYRRLLTFEPICSDGSIRSEGTNCGGLIPVQGVRVTSRVVWDARGTRRESVIVDELYDWR